VCVLHGAGVALGSRATQHPGEGMSESDGTPSTVRQRCPESPSKVLTLAVLALLVSGCVPDHWECVVSS
jgi:hypothetical protein